MDLSSRAPFTCYKFDLYQRVFDPVVHHWHLVVASHLRRSKRAGCLRLHLHEGVDLGILTRARLVVQNSHLVLALTTNAIFLP